MEIQTKKHRSPFTWLTIAALGVVYGDIGTSPLYALKETFFGHHPLALNTENILGVLSLFFWSLILVVTLKYVFLITRADNHGEGGIFALLGLIKNERWKLKPKLYFVISSLVIVGAALLYGDGAITPTISVLSAVEGLRVALPTLEHLIIPLTAIILVLLFAIQRRGTEKVGMIFGPVMLLWFATLAALGIPQILAHPEVLLSVNPWYAVKFALEYGFATLFTLGAVVLCVTGGEALYADMGHFGRKVIRNAWMFLVLPSLLINYFGQGARLLYPLAIPGNNLFYALAPDILLIPLIVLSTIATVIASQALISGCYSLTHQAISLGIFPRLKILHTNPHMEGQIYMPFINWALCLACLLLLFGFRSSSALAAAYGIAVTGTMAITTFTFYVVARHIWGWRWWVIPVCGLFIFIDLTFYAANTIKFLEGGFVPILIAAGLYLLMRNWEWGKARISGAYEELPGLTVRQFLDRKKTEHVINRSVVVLNSRPLRNINDKIPPQLQTFFDRWLVIPKHIIVLTFIEKHLPYVQKESDHFVLHRIEEDELGTFVAIEANFGYMQFPRVRKELHRLKSQGLIKIPHDSDKWLILAGQERIVTDGKNLLDRIRLRLFKFLLSNAKPATSYFDLDADFHVSIEERNI